MPVERMIVIFVQLYLDKELKVLICQTQGREEHSTDRFKSHEQTEMRLSLR